MLMCGVIAVTLTGCSDPEKEANIIFVDAAAMIQSASNLDTLGKFKAYTDAKAKLDQLAAEEFKGTQASLKVASQEKIGGLSSAELAQEIDKLSASNAVCGSIRSDECVSRIIETSVSEFGTGGNTDRMLPDLLARLELSGKTSESRKFLTAFATKIGRPDISAQLPSIMPEVLRDGIKSLAYTLSPEERLVIYRRAMSIEGLQWSPQAKSQVAESLIRGSDWSKHPDDVLALLNDLGDANARSDVALAVLESMAPLTGSAAEIEFLNKLTSLISPSKVQAGLAKLVASSKQNVEPVMKLMPDETKRLELTKEVGTGLWAWDSGDRLDYLLQLPPEVLRARPFQIMDAALEAKDRRDDALKLLAAIEGTEGDDSNAMALYPLVKGTIDGSGDFSTLPELARSSLTAEGLSDRSQFMCGAAVRLAAMSAQSGIVSSMAEVCMPLFSLTGSQRSSAWAAFRDFVPAARHADIEDMRAALAKLEQVPGYAEHFDTIIHTLLHSKQAELALELTTKQRPLLTRENVDRIYPHLMSVALSTEGGKPDVIWPILKETASDRQGLWLVAEDKLTEAGRAVLDKALVEDADFIAGSVLRLDREYQNLGALQMLTKAQLVALSKNIKKPELKAGILDALALRVRSGDPEDMKESVWALPDGQAAAAIRIATIGLGASLDAKTQ